MGKLAGKLHKDVFANSRDDIPTEPREGTLFSSRFTVEMDEAVLQRRKQALESLVAERNNLIHQDLARFDPTSPESCRVLIEKLDSQNMRIAQQIDGLVILLNGFRDILNHILELEESGVIERMLRDQ
jgi:hypothetical protein